MPIRHRHQSWLHKAIETAPDAVSEALAEHRANCTVLTGTEGAGPKWKPLLTEPGWGLQRGEGEFNAGDPWISWDQSIWEHLAGWTRELSEISYEGRRAHAAVERLRHWQRRDVEVTFICHHLPAHIGRLIRIWRTSDQERAYKEALQSLQGMALRIRRNHPESRIVIVGDWNLDMHSVWVRRRLSRAMRGTGLRLVPVRGEGGTHGRRLIDWAFTDLDSRGEVLPRIAASDHRGVAFVHQEA